MEILGNICTGITTVLSVLMIYQVVYAVIGFFCKAKKYPEAKTMHSYGIVIAARNERLVIGNLLDSIAAQNYDMSLVRVFVVADNCTDDTAEICRAKGAIVYERNDPTRARKGYAMEYLFSFIERDYGVESLEGYLVFDADNLLHPDYLKEINKAFDTGVDAAVGYRNTKNFSTNLISAGYGIHFCRSSALMHRPRALLNVPTHIAGTGYVLRSHLLRDGWHFTSLTEDTEFTLTSVADGLHIAFCEEAEFFDEQPYSMGVMVRQRLRWSKGRLFCFLSCAWGLLRGCFVKPRGGKVGRFGCYDMFFYAFPKGLFSALVSLIYAVASVAVFGFSTEPQALADGALGLARSLLISYLGFVLIGAVTVIRERKHIHCSTLRLIWYTVAFPWFDLLGLPIAIASLFMRVKWKPIRHDKAVRIDELAPVSRSEKDEETIEETV